MAHGGGPGGTVPLPWAYLAIVVCAVTALGTALATFRTVLPAGQWERPALVAAASGVAAVVNILIPGPRSWWGSSAAVLAVGVVAPLVLTGHARGRTLLAVTLATLAVTITVATAVRWANEPGLGVGLDVDVELERYEPPSDETSFIGP